MISAYKPDYGVCKQNNLPRKIRPRKTRPPQGLFFGIFKTKIRVNLSRANFPRGYKDTSKDIIYFYRKMIVV